MRCLVAGGLMAVLISPAWAQDSSPEIDLGSSRIGGPGLTESERRWVEQFDEPVEYLTEENIPKKGSKKRLPALHTLAARYVATRQWAEACDKFDTIQKEGEEEGEEENETDRITTFPDGAKNAHRAYYHCARIAASKNDGEKTERLLELSETFGPSTPKHTRVREKVLRNRYRKKVADGDFDGAIGLFHKAQAIHADEDERIWLGQQLAEHAWQAYEQKDRVALDGLLQRTAEIAPLNTDYRRLKDKLDNQGSILRNVLVVVASIVLFMVLWTVVNRWRSKRLVQKAMTSQFDDL